MHQNVGLQDSLIYSKASRLKDSQNYLKANIIKKSQTKDSQDCFGDNKDNQTKNKEDYQGINIQKNNRFPQLRLSELSNSFEPYNQNKVPVTQKSIQQQIESQNKRQSIEDQQSIQNENGSKQYQSQVNNHKSVNQKIESKKTYSNANTSDHGNSIQYQKQSNFSQNITLADNNKTQLANENMRQANNSDPHKQKEQDLQSSISNYLKKNPSYQMSPRNVSMYDFNNLFKQKHQTQNSQKPQIRLNQIPNKEKNSYKLSFNYEPQSTKEKQQVILQATKSTQKETKTQKLAQKSENKAQTRVKSITIQKETTQTQVNKVNKDNSSKNKEIQNQIQKGNNKLIIKKEESKKGNNIQNQKLFEQDLGKRIIQYMQKVQQENKFHKQHQSSISKESQAINQAQTKTIEQTQKQIEQRDKYKNCMNQIEQFRKTKMKQTYNHIKNSFGIKLSQIQNNQNPEDSYYKEFWDYLTPRANLQQNENFILKIDQDEILPDLKQQIESKNSPFQANPFQVKKNSRNLQNSILTSPFLSKDCSRKQSNISSCQGNDAQIQELCMNINLSIVEAQKQNLNSSVCSQNQLNSNENDYNNLKNTQLIMQALSYDQISFADIVDYDQEIQHQLQNESPDVSPRNYMQQKVDQMQKTSDQIQILYKEQLNEKQEEEIQQYSVIYYLTFQWKDQWDNSKGDYIIEPHEQLQYRYEILQEIGSGTFGKVVKCFDHKEKQYVALKIINSNEKFTKQAEAEIKMLKHIKSIDTKNISNTVKYLDHFYFRKHLCIVQELLYKDLYVIMEKKGFRGLKIQCVKIFVIQILQHLSFLAQHNIIHCDLKPENILITEQFKFNIKIIDFGSAVFANEVLHSYVQSRFYRAPEIILGMHSYSYQIDMWSFGCIIAELITGKPLFPGKDEHDQLFQILCVCGLPSQDILNQCTRANLYFDENGQPLLVNSQLKKAKNQGWKNQIRQIIRVKDEQFVDLLMKCLKFDPKSRITAEQALAHEWLKL